MAQITVSEWIKMMQEEQDVSVKRREQLLFDIASFILGKAKFYAKEKFGRGAGLTARTSGRSGALMRSIEMARVDSKTIIVTAGGPGVPYAAVHELGTKRKGGILPSIVSKRPGGSLTIPLLPQFIGRRATEFDLHIEKPKGSKFAFLADNRGQMAYLLLKRVDIPPRPYLKPAAEDASKDANIMGRIKILFGTSKLPYEVTRI